MIGLVADTSVRRLSNNDDRVLLDALLSSGRIMWSLCLEEIVLNATYSVAPCACASLRRASRAVCHLYDLVLAPQSLKTSQFLVLLAIAECEPIAHCELARRFVASEETFSRRLASARKAGWVQMTVDARRRRVYSLTERGRELLNSARPSWQRAQERLRQQLGEDDWNALLLLTERITGAALRAERAPCRNAPPALRCAPNIHPVCSLSTHICPRDP